MASDEIVWQVINQQFCSFKLKTTKEQTFCRNEYNVTGICSRQSCPLANSRYATVRANPDTGVLYLFIKTVERSHMPSKWWERIRLSGTYAKALEQVDERLKYWPKFLVHKCKQRLTRLTQVAIRTRRLAKDDERLGERVVTKMAPKVRKREQARERKAEAAAKVERQIERELIERLTSGAYGDRPLNADERVWRRVMKAYERKGEVQRDQDLDDGIEDEDEEDDEELEFEHEGQDGDVEYVSDIDGASDDDDDGVEDLEDWLDGHSSDEASDSDGRDELPAAALGAKRKANGAPAPTPPKRGKILPAMAANPLRKGLDGKDRTFAVTAKPKSKPKPKAKSARREIEYEVENEPPLRELA